MNWDLDDLLEMVDEWKFKLHEKLKGMTPVQRAEFWRQTHQASLARRKSARRKIKKSAAQRT